MKSEWKRTKLKDLVEFNPRESLAKGTLAKKVTMSDLVEKKRKIRNFHITEYKGGTLFRNGDILFARITPSLENGKIAQVDILEDNEIGFGSTEFIVWRAIAGVSDPGFVYYLANYGPIVETAIRSMSGTSGRQRVQLDALKDFACPVPPLRTQKAIADTLSCLDAKIDLNDRMNENLEKQAQAIFKSWFVDFEPFQDSDFVESQYGWIPQGWRLGRLGEFIEVTSGKRPIVKTNQRTPNNKVPVIGASRVMGYTNESLFDDRVLVIGRVGTHGVVQRIDFPCWPSDNTLVIKSQFYEFAYQVLKRIDYSSINRGSTQPLITQRDLRNQVIVVPPESVLRRYEDVASSLLEVVRNNLRENQTLSSLRDTLLPKLMSGEIEVPVV